MSSIVKLFANPSLVEVLNLFLINPEEQFYQKEIAKKTNYELIQIQRALKLLEKIALISSSRQGKMIYYQAMRNHYAFEDLKALFLKSVSVGELIRKSLIPFQDKIQLAFIFGSVAKATDSNDSDIDLFILADLTLRELSKALSPLSKQIGRELNPIVFDAREVKNRISQKDHFMLELLSTPKLWIVGNEDHLNRLVKRTKAQGT